MQRVLLAFSLPFMVGACSDYALKGKPPAGEEGVETLDIYRGIIHFVILQVVGLLMVLAFPEVSLWLARISYD